VIWSSAASTPSRGRCSCSTAPRRCARRSESPVQRCIRHKERNVLDHLPERDRPAVKRRLRAAWAEHDHARALDRLQTLAGELERTHPGAAGSLREGLEETLTLTRLGIRDNLKRTLESTNPEPYSADFDARRLLLG
jgi:transposase-like protein